MTSPLPDAVLAEIAATMGAYGIDFETFTLSSMGAPPERVTSIAALAAELLAARKALRERAPMPFPKRVRLTGETAFVPYKVGDIVTVIPQHESHDIKIEGGWVLYPGTWEPVESNDA